MRHRLGGCDLVKGQRLQPSIENNEGKGRRANADDSEIHIMPSKL